MRKGKIQIRKILAARMTFAKELSEKFRSTDLVDFSRFSETN